MTCDNWLSVDGSRTAAIHNEDDMFEKYNQTINLQGFQTQIKKHILLKCMTIGYPKG